MLRIRCDIRLRQTMYAKLVEPIPPDIPPYEMCTAVLPLLYGLGGRFDKSQFRYKGLTPIASANKHAKPLETLSCVCLP